MHVLGHQRAVVPALLHLVVDVEDCEDCDDRGEDLEAVGGERAQQGEPDAALEGDGGEGGGCED